MRLTVAGWSVSRSRTGVRSVSRSKTLSVADRAEWLCDVADELHPVEKPSVDDLRVWEDWTVARRLRELAAGLLEN